MIETITAEDVLRLASEDSYYSYDRWQYYKAAIDLIRIVNPATVIELGPHKLPICPGCDTINKNGTPTFKLDASRTPWGIPVPDGRYDLFIGLQVWEHLGTSQAAAFEEATRLARFVLLSFPYKWKNGSPDHNGIDDEIIRQWTMGTDPYHRVLVRGKSNRLVCLWDVR